MTDNPNKTPWGEMTDAEQAALLLSHHRKNRIDCLIDGEWETVTEPTWGGNSAYRVRPAPVAPKVETVTKRCNIARMTSGSPYWSGGVLQADETLANITHTYTVTDGVVTCDTTITHPNTYP